MVSQQSRYDFFISYAEADRAWVEGYLLDALTAARKRVIHEDAFELGAPRLDEFERAVRESDRVLLVVSRAYLVDEANHFVELLARHYGWEVGKWPVIPLLREEVDLPTRLALLVSDRMTSDEEAKKALTRLLAMLPPEPIEKPECPYPGMRSYTRDERNIFFGRDNEIDDLIRRIRVEPLILVVGPSGSGKSSLLLAGLLPKLEVEGWGDCVLRPGVDPQARLREAVAGYVDFEAARRIDDSHKPLLVVVDQLEELFSLTASADDDSAEAKAEKMARQDGFITDLRRLTEIAQTKIVLTMRADFFGDLMEKDALWTLVKGRRKEIKTLDSDNLREAIIRPAEQVDVYVEQALVERLVADANGEPGMLPFVQATLHLLWERLERRFLPISAYDTLVAQQGSGQENGLLVAIGVWADATYNALETDERKRLARRTLLRLIQFGEGREDTRRQQHEADLRAVGDDPAEFQDVLSHLVDRRLLTTSSDIRTDSRDFNTDERLVDLAHEALIRGWPSLRGWVDQRREAELTRRRLEAKAEEYEHLSGKGGLLDSVELADAKKWCREDDAAELGVSQDLINLMNASARRILWQRIGIFGTALFIVALTIVALLYYNRLQQQRIESEQAAAAWLAASRNREEVSRIAAEVNESRAVQAEGEARVQESVAKTNESKTLSALSQLQLSSDPVAALNLALDALPSVTNTRPYLPEAEYALMAAVQASMESGYYSSGQLSLTADELAFAGNNIVGKWVALGGSDVRLVAPDLSEVVLPDAPRADRLAWLDETTLIGSDGDVVHLWRDPAAAWRKPGTNSASADMHVDCLAPRPSSRQFALCVRDGIQIWQVEDGKLLTTTQTIPVDWSSGDMRIVRWSPNGEWMVTGVEGMPLLWKLGAGEGLQASSSISLTHRIVPGGFQFIDDDRLATWGRARTIRLWELPDSPDAVIPIPSVTLSVDSLVSDVSVAPSGNELFVHHKDGSGALWVLEGEPTEALATFVGHQGPIRSVAWHPVGPYIATAAEDGTARVWQIEGSRVTEINKLVGHRNGDRVEESIVVYSVRWKEDSEELLTVGEDGTVRTWRAFRSQPARLAAHERRIVGLDWRDEKTVLAVCKDGFIDTIDVTSGKVITQSMGVTTVKKLQFHPSQPLLFVVDGNRAGVVHDLDSGESTQLFSGPENQFHAFALSPGSLLAAGRADGMVELWDLAGGRLSSFAVVDPAESITEIKNLAWLDNGEALLAATSAKIVRCRVDLEAVEETDACEPVVTKEAGSAIDMPIAGFLLSPSNDYLAVRDMYDQLIVVKADTGNRLAKRSVEDVCRGVRWVTRHPWPYQGTDTDAKEHELLLFAVKNKLILWDPEANRDVFQIVGEPDDLCITEVATGPQRDRIAMVTQSSSNLHVVKVRPIWLEDPEKLLNRAKLMETRDERERLIGVGRGSEAR